MNRLREPPTEATMDMISLNSVSLYLNTVKLSNFSLRRMFQ